jgi:hypothetical protein
MCRKYANTSPTSAKKKVAVNPANYAPKQRLQSAPVMKKNILTSAHRAALNAAKQKGQDQKMMRMFHNNENLV